MSNRAKIVAATVTALVTAVFVGLSVYAWQQSVAKRQQSELQRNALAPSFTPTDETTSQTTSWETYANQLYNYSLKYPLGASVRETKEESGFINDPQSCMTIQYGKGGVVHLRAKGAKTRCSVEGSESGAAIQQPLVVDGQRYIARGAMFRDDPEYASDILEVSLSDGMQITFGVIAEKSLSREDYNRIKDTVIQIVESYRTT